MLLRNGTEIAAVRDVSSILIPDGTEHIIVAGSQVFIQHVLGGMFTVQTNDGLMLRIDGKDADAIGQEIPKERREITALDVKTKGIEACVTEQLKTCYDPEIPVNILDLGLIYQQEVRKFDDDQFAVRIEMTLTAPGCGMGEVLKSDVTKKISEIPTVNEVIVDLVFDPPWASHMMSDAAKLQLGFL